MRKLFVFGFVLVLFPSCQKEKPVESKSSYAPLAIGNYWIYQNFNVDEAGIETATSIVDSVTVTRDTVVNSQTYYVLEGTNQPFNENRGVIDLLRDSSGYLVNRNGLIRFAENDFTKELARKVEIQNGDTLFTLVYQMEKQPLRAVVPAGTFDVLNYRGTLNYPTTISGLNNPRYINIQYANNVGKVSETILFYSDPRTIEKRLVRYHIQKAND